MWSVFWFCLGMFLMLSLFVVFLAYTTGNIAFPGTEKSRVMRAKNDAKIAEFEAQAQQSRFDAAQAKVNRDIMNEKAAMEIDRMMDKRLALGRGEE